MVRIVGGARAARRANVRRRMGRTPLALLAQALRVEHISGFRPTRHGPARSPESGASVMR